MKSAWPSSFDDFAADESAAATICNRTSTNKRKFEVVNGSQKSDRKPNTSTWIDRYDAKSFEELAVHKKKAAEVESWISNSKLSNNASILLLTGPSGCGKTATVRLAAKAHSMEVCEWSNPLSVSYHVTKDAGLPYQSLASQFEEFLFRSGRYPSLQFSDTINTTQESNVKKRLLLLEDLPYHIIREPLVFRDILRQFKRYQRNSLVIIISDRSIPDLTRRNLLPPDVLSQLKVKVISFNPIATTSMTKALSRVMSKEHHSLSKEQLNQVVATASGDIRTAINSLQFLLQKGTPVPLQSQSKKSKVLKRHKSMDLMKADSVPCIGGKDVSLLLFRALGKILYCKREYGVFHVSSHPMLQAFSISRHFYKSAAILFLVFHERRCILAGEKREGQEVQLPPSLSHHHRDPMIFEPEEILQHCCLSGSAYSLFIHHNCVPFLPKLENLSCVFDDFALGDVISARKVRNDFSVESYEALDAYQGSIAARSVAFWNTDRATVELCESATGQWRPLHKPSWYEASKKRGENQLTGRAIFWSYNLPSDELLLTQLPFVRKIVAARNNFSSVRGSSSAMELSLDQEQKNFLTAVVSLPKWKSFTSADSNRISDVEMGDQTFEGTVDDVMTLAKEGDFVEGGQDPDEDFAIEEFSD